MRDLKLSTKIIGLASILLVILIAISYVSISKIKNIGMEVVALAEEDIPMTELMTEITLHQLGQSAWLERALRFGRVIEDEEEENKSMLEQAEHEFEALAKETDEHIIEAEKLIGHAITVAHSDADRQELTDLLAQLKKADGHHGEYEHQVETIFNAINKGDNQTAAILATKLEKAQDQLNKEIEGILLRIEEFTKAAATNAEHQEKMALRLLLILSATGLALGLVVSFLVTRSITKPITRAIMDLDMGATQVASASGQIASASQQLAAGASEQAASLEETSASLEEITSMTSQNADNANQANVLATDSSSKIKQANDSMQKLTVAMEEITEASQETSKIIKTIDEIAFQTNLLALNAAVEAARAGEVGAGFAVVADEVRNLAMRAAEAAKTTADLIETTVTKIQNGREYLQATDLAFGEVSGSSAKIGQLVSEISSASQEQVNGVSQINSAIIEIDQVTQQNAANSEESASASEEMNAQAYAMKDIVAELNALINGSRNSQSKAIQAQAAVAEKNPVKAIKQKAGLRKKSPNPSEIIPFNDDDDVQFEDFGYATQN